MTIALAALLLGGASSAALAQTPPPGPAPAPAPKSQSAKPEGKTVEEVTVSGVAADVQTSIDRRSYTLGKDLQATTGSIGDALRNVPAVEVDLQGNLTLRGDPNVTILIDGKPSGAFNGASRADALQQLPADQIERVEVVTTPSAADNPEGSGGIINLITKKSRGAGKTGSVFATAGSSGLYRVGGTFGYNSKKLSVTASASGNRQNGKFVGHDTRAALNPATGQFLSTRIDSVGRNLNQSPNLRLAINYTLDPKTQLSASLDYSGIDLDGHPFNHYETLGSGGLPISILNRQGERDFSFDNIGGSVGWKRSFAGEGHQLSVDASGFRFKSTDFTINTNVSTPPLTTGFDTVLSAGDQRHSELKVAYNRPLPKSAKLRAGYEFRYDDNSHDDVLARGPTLPAVRPDAAFSNRLESQQAVHSVYTTYERPFDDLTVQLGLRIEALHRDLDQITSHTTNTADYVRAYPSFHFDYKLDDGRKLSGGYGVRVQRPPEPFLNPFLIFSDPKNLRQGNPDLEPQETQSYEVAYESRKGQTLLLGTAYYRRAKNEFTGILRDLGAGVFLTTFENLGDSQSAGVELVANGRLSKTLTYNASTNIYWTQVNSGVAADGGARSATGVSGRANLNWQVRPDDLVQINAFAQGPRLAAQGRTYPIYSLNLGWRHKVNDRVTATVTAQDLFDSNRIKQRFDTPIIRDDFEGYIPISRAISLRLDYRFGGGPARGQRDPGFEYENAAPAAPQ